MNTPAGLAGTFFVQACTINGLRSGILWLSYGSAMARLHPPSDLFQKRPRDRARGAVATAGPDGLAVFRERYA